MGCIPVLHLHTRLFPVHLVLLPVRKEHSGVVESLCLGLLDLGVLEQCLSAEWWYRVLAPFCLCGVDGHGRGPTDFSWKGGKVHLFPQTLQSDRRRIWRAEHADAAVFIALKVDEELK